MLIIFVAPAGLVREGVARLLGDFDERAEVRCAEYTDASECGASADLLVLDGDHAREALDAALALRLITPGLPVLVLLTEVNQQTIDSFIAAGVASCLKKSESADELFRSLRRVLADDTYLPDGSRAFVREAASPCAAQARPHSAIEQGTAVRVLTPRQIEVLALAARGESNKTIAQQLEITEGTVKVHLYAIYKALKVGSRGQASIAAARLRRVGDAQLQLALDAQLTVKRLLSHTSLSRFRSGDVLFHKDAPSDALYYIVHGAVVLQEIEIEVRDGTIIGEIGLFSPDHRRTCTAICKTDCDLLVVSATDVMRMYYQDPEFATYLIHLIARRLKADKLRSK